MKVFLLPIFLLLFLYSPAQKNTITLSKESVSSSAFVKELEVLIDSSQNLTFAQVQNDSSLKFVPASDIRKPGKHVYWVRVNIKSNYAKDVPYRISAVWWDYLTAYLVYPDSTVQILYTGLLRKKSEMDGKDFASFILPAGKEIKLYAKLEASGYFLRMDSVNILLSKHETALENERYYLYLSAMLFGIMIGFAFYNLSISISTREISYVWYFLYLFCLAISFSGQLGSHSSYLTQFFLPEHPVLGLFLKRLLDPAAFICLILFSRNFLHTRQKHPRWDTFLLALIFVLISLNIFWLGGGYNRAGAPYIIISVYILSVIVIIKTALIAYREGFKAARFFIAGQIITAAGILISMFKVTGWADLLWFLPHTRFFDFIRSGTVFFFGGVEALIFSMALADRQRIKLEQEVAERTSELKQSLQELKSAQSQLIQKEKMASLGELTAGIAHEIQNPLNFVNNFSEVSNELIEELKGERRKTEGERNTEAEDELLNDIEENLQKINHHGKRADAIVKGMLQHSRSSNGVKEPTDINVLCDEYLRLSYRGQRAKDKNFNAEIKTDFDKTVGKINVVPLDIGRVLLNLYNNAFYAVSAPPPKAGALVTNAVKDPTVWVSTKKDGNKVLITVRDNGKGIPANIVDKIFQPFFTTKPTGQGTGLGLSLSYDIIKAHGGEIKVESKDGEGSEFVFTLPLKSQV